MRLFYISIILLLSSEIFGRETRYLMQSPYALLMGDTYTSLVNDDYILFYNPAALARKIHGSSFRPLNVNLQVMNALDKLDLITNMPSDTAEMVDSLMDFPVHVQAGIAPGFTMGPFGLSLFANTTTNFMIRNSTHPILNLDYRLDRGIVFGYGHMLSEENSLGVSIKRINRAGIDQQYHMFGVELLNVVAEGGSLDDMRTSLGYNSGAGWGFDLGFLHRKKINNGEVAFGVSVFDILGTSYSQGGVDVVDVPDQEMIVKSGVSWQQKFLLFDYKFGVDLHPVLDSMDLRRKVHVGIDLGFPLFRILVGWNGGYLSYGVKIRFWPFDIIAGLYGTEIGTSYRQEKSSRAIIYLSLLDFSFDG